MMVSLISASLTASSQAPKACADKRMHYPRLMYDVPKLESCVGDPLASFCSKLWAGRRADLPCSCQNMADGVSNSSHAFTPKSNMPLPGWTYMWYVQAAYRPILYSRCCALPSICTVQKECTDPENLYTRLSHSRITNRQSTKGAEVGAEGCRARLQQLVEQIRPPSRAEQLLGFFSFS